MAYLFALLTKLHVPINYYEGLVHVNNWNNPF